CWRRRRSGAARPARVHVGVGQSSESRRRDAGERGVQGSWRKAHPGRTDPRGLCRQRADGAPRTRLDGFSQSAGRLHRLTFLTKEGSTMATSDTVTDYFSHLKNGAGWESFLADDM